MMAEGEEGKPYIGYVFVGASILNKSGCRRIKLHLTQQRQKPATTLNCQHSCTVLCPKAESWWERIPPLPPHFLSIASSARLLCDLNGELLLVLTRWGGVGIVKQSPAVSQTHFGIIICFSCFLSFFCFVSW